MKICTILLVMFASISNTKAKPSSVYHVGNLGQVVAVSYRPLVFGLRPIQRCFENNILSICQTSSQDARTDHRLIPKRHQSHPVMNYSEKLSQNIHVANLAHGNHKTLRSSPNPIVRPVKNVYKKLEKPNMKSIVNHFPMLTPVESSYEIVASIKNLPEELETEIFFSERVQTMENTSNKNKETLENSFKHTESEVSSSENVDAENTLSEVDTTETLLENIESTPEFVEYSISPATENVSVIDQNYLVDQNMFYERLIFALDQFERKLYVTNFNKFLTLTLAPNAHSGMSFVQSGLFLGITLMALSTEADLDTKNEIDQNIILNVSDLEKIKLIKQVMSSLPNSSAELKFRWSSRLVLRSGRQLSQQFTSGAAAALQLKIDHFEDTHTPVAMAQVLNRMIEEDSDGAIRDTFEEDDLSNNEEAVLISTLYLRARWRSAPTLLNGTWVFRDMGNAPSRTIRMIRINDIMKYIDLPEWDAEAIEMPYLTQGLSLLMLVPRGNSLRRLVQHVTGTNLTSITERMQNMRIAVSLPLYTLRMTLLLPNKLQAMGISHLVDASKAEGGFLRISQAVQRIMFWAEAGRNAYKDDGLEWDAPPEMNIVVDRPYMFSVRWQNMSLMIGNFVL